MPDFKDYLKQAEQINNEGTGTETEPTVFPGIDPIEKPVEPVKEKVEEKVEPPKPRRRRKKIIKEVKEEKPDTNLLLLEAINKLIEKLDNMQFEIPTPIVNVSLPERKIIKEVKRDKKGNVTHIIETVEKE